MDRDKAKEQLQTMHVILSVLKIPFFLINGTALGAWRDKDFTPTEKDIDLGFLYEDFAPHVTELVAVLAAQHYELQTVAEPFTRIRTIVAQKDTIKFDLVSFARWHDVRFASRPVHPRADRRYSIVHPAKLLEQWTTIAFHRLPCAMPLEIETYLQLEYGDEWRVPKEDHVSRSRVYDFVEQENIPRDLLEHHPKC